MRVLEFVFKRPWCEEFKIEVLEAGKRELGRGAAREGAGAAL